MKTFTPRQKEIINTAIELIAQKGIQELTIKNLSQHIGIAESAIYRHFASKMDILLGILEIFKEHKDQLNSLVNNMQTSTTEKLRSMLSLHFSHFSANRAMASVIFSEELFRNDHRLSEQIYQIMLSNQEMVTAILQEGQQKGEFRQDVSAKQLCYMITGALRLIVTHWRLSNFQIDLIQEGEKLWETIHSLIKNPAS